ncbi:uncharacterized protein LOC129926539 isoform X1 [Biomphalaria glabrata]|uniref:Uncharacterized protein LOC129926539 isoform X1 n=2 Tax=Biomphalaria glabrata TaxID=6526 RepID=A0A9W3AJI9_BIOGL|nr:uncharacterized protein LOC129926539 isoform X1 [Biomphalaria glabrata]KAI8754384.1 hypothetical protein BgiMline_012850 [Biomphalaria glabrata]
MASFTSNPGRLEGNKNVSYMGMLRQCLPRRDLASEEAKKIASRYSIDKPDFYFANHHQVGNWAASVGLGEFSPLFVHYLINGRRLLTLDALALEKLGSRNVEKNLRMENAIRDLRHQLLRESETFETLPYFTTQALNLGRWPPQRYHRQLFQFTDPWLTENYNFLDISANDLCLRLKNHYPPRPYMNTRAI